MKDIVNSFNIQFDLVIFSSSYQRKPTHKLNQNTKEKKGANSTKTLPTTSKQYQQKYQRQPYTNSTKTNENEDKEEAETTKKKKKGTLVTYLRSRRGRE